MRALLPALALLVGCASATPPAPPPPPPIDTLAGVSMIVSGQRVRVGVPVITWLDPGGFDAYRERCAFRDAVLPSKPAEGCDTPRRYAPRDDPANIDLVVVHYDVAWTSRNCFKVLHDIRGLSCHFLLDVDGKLYQTLDVVDRARHAAGVNERAIGIEIAHPGPVGVEGGPDAASYTRDPDGRTRFDLGKLAADLPPGFVARPARRDPISGPIHGKTYTMYDYTDAQYDSLAHLLAALARALPAIRLEAPRDASGAVVTTVADRATIGRAAGVGVVGHFHVGSHKQDPGPAFDWERALSAARALLGR